MANSDLESRILADLKQAMKERDELRKAVLRMVKSDLDHDSKASDTPLDQKHVYAVLRRQVKQRNEAARIYQQGGQQNRADRELAEAEILSGYLPAQLDSEEIARHIDEAIAETGSVSLADLGKVMGRLSGVLAGQADMQQVVSSVRAKLSS